MGNEILELKVTACADNSYGNYIITLSDVKSKEYLLTIHDKIPIAQSINLNLYYHNLVQSKNGNTIVSVKQRFKGNQPSKLELEIAEIKTISAGAILTLIDTTTQDSFKLKVSSCPSKVGERTVLDFKKKDAGMVIKCQPHFFNGAYSIENWIINGKDD